MERWGLTTSARYQLSGVVHLLAPHLFDLYQRSN